MNNSERQEKYQALLSLGRTHEEAIIELMERPGWDDYWMGMAFYMAMRSPDSQTKQGCLIVDWDTKTLIGSGYNGHLKGLENLPTYRAGTKLPDGTVQAKPDKYDFMIHADENAVARVTQKSEYAVMYVTMTPCERCISQALNSPHFKLRRVVFFEERDFQITKSIIDLWNQKHPWQSVEMVMYASVEGKMSAKKALDQAGLYLLIRRRSQQDLSFKSTLSYRDINQTKNEQPNSDSVTG